MMKKIKILFLAANPSDTDRLGLDSEFKKIRALWRESPQRDDFAEPRCVFAANREDLQDELLNFQPDILHFSGHGEQDGLYLQDAQGDSQFLEQAALTRLLGGRLADSLRCVVLNACQTEAQASAFSRHIDYVVGMSHAIGDAAAIDFSAGFYRALFSKDGVRDGKLDIPLAFEGGRCAIDLTQLDEWQTPQLKRRPIILPFSPPFLPHYPVDVLVHAAEVDQDWATDFVVELRKHLTQQLATQQCAIQLYSAAPDFAHAPVHLWVVSAQDFNTDLADNKTTDTKQFVIARSRELPDSLAGLSQYPFLAARANAYPHSALFQELAQVLARHLVSLKQTEQIRVNEKPFGESLVFIHTEPDETQARYAKSLKAHFKSKGLACASSNPKDYREDVRSNQKICQGVLIVCGENDRWAKDRIADYFRLQQKRKETLKVVVIHADCSHAEKDMEAFDVYPSVPVFPCPPQRLEDMVQRFVEGMKK